jgi:hypothetical protein
MGGRIRGTAAAAVLALSLPVLPSDLRGDLELRTDPLRFTGTGAGHGFQFPPPRALRVTTPVLQMTGARR